MTRSSELISDYTEYGKTKMSYIVGLKGAVVVKIKSLTKRLKAMEKTHQKCKEIVEHLLEEKKFDLCEHYAKYWFAMLMVLQDNSQYVQTGKQMFKIYQVNEDVCADREGDFTWDLEEGHKLNNSSVQGLKYCYDQVKLKMAKHEGYDKSLEKKVQLKSLPYENLCDSLLATDAAIKEMARDIETVGNKVFRATLMPHGTETMEMQFSSGVRYFTRVQFSGLINENLESIVKAIDTQQLINPPADADAVEDAAAANQDASYSTTFFARRDVEMQVDAVETAAALEKLRVVAAERTAADKLLQEEKLTAIAQNKVNQVAIDLTNDRDKARQRVFKAMQREAAGVGVSTKKKTSSALANASSTSVINANKTKEPKRVVEDDDCFIAPEGDVPMRQNKRKGFMEEDSDYESEGEKTGAKSKEKTKRKKSENTAVAVRPYMNSALSKYLEASGRAQVESQDSRSQSESDESRQQALAQQAVVNRSPSEVEIGGDYGDQTIMTKLYNSLNYMEVMSKTSTMNQEERCLAVDMAFCEVVVNDVCDTVMRNLYRDVNTAVFWYQSRIVRDCDAKEVAVIKHHQWLLFFIDVKAKALARLMIKPKVTQRPDQGGLPSAPLITPLGKKDHCQNDARKRTVNTAINKLAKKIIYVYETLNETLDDQDLAQFEGCGYVLPSSSTNMSEIYRSIEVDEDNVLQLIAGADQDPKFADFKEIVMSKMPRDCLETHAKKMQAKKDKAEKERLEKEAEAEKERVAKETADKARSQVLGPAPTAPKKSLTSDSASADEESRNHRYLNEEEEGREAESGGLQKRVGDLSAIMQQNGSSPNSMTPFDGSSSTSTSPAAADERTPPFHRVNFDRVSKILKLMFNNSVGECEGICIEHNKLKRKDCSRQQYINQLAHIVCMIAAYKTEGEYIGEDDFGDIVYESKNDEVMKIQVFIVRKTFKESEVELAYDYNTPSDGYCMWWMTFQLKIRVENPRMSMEHLREVAFQDSDVDVELADHIQHYLDTVQYKEKQSQSLAVTQLTNMLSRAREFPREKNPFKLWGNSKLCRFIDVRLMLFCLDDAAAAVKETDGVVYKVAQLAIVNHALGDMYQDGAPQFTLNQLLDMFSLPNYAGFMNSHFFVLENPPNMKEVEKVNEAYKDWLHGIVEAVNGMSDSDLQAVRDFHSNNKYHSNKVVDLATESDDEYDENLLSDEDDEEEDIDLSANDTQHTASTQRVRFRGEVSFSKAHFDARQREELLLTIDLLEQRIKEMSHRDNSLNLSVNSSSTISHTQSQVKQSQVQQSKVKSAAVVPTPSPSASSTQSSQSVKKKTNRKSAGVLSTVANGE